ncbi:MAG TPA: glycosyltransferase [Verrucomicrobiae bacterium]|nr:glycosyltransferase [Verrucomicrobiae bacterium]
MTSSGRQSTSSGNSTLAAYFDEAASHRDHWVARNRYYHDKLAESFAFHIPSGNTVFEVGSGTGHLLAALKPARGLGIDLSPAMVRLAQQSYPNLEFRVEDAMTLNAAEKFDYVVISDLLGFLPDVQCCFENLRQACHSRTRLVISFYNALWQPLLALAERGGLKARQPAQNWLGMADVENLLYLAGFEVILRQPRLLLPVNVPLLAPLCNRYLVNLPVLGHLGLVAMIVARLKPVQAKQSPSVSIIVPARNERGNIEAVVQQTPQLGDHTELIFVEGNSTDGTAQEIERVIAAHPDKDIKLIPQGSGRGKGDAVRKGFHAARCDVLMILDADLTVSPEDLPKFYHTLISGLGEFVHGSRFVYPMEKRAMRFLNMLGNKFFSVAFTHVLGQRFKDTLCGTKVLFRRDYEKIAANRSYFGEFDPFGDFDLIFGATKLDLKIVEIPVHYRERTYGTTNISRFRHGWLLLRMVWYALWKIKLV